MATVVVRLQNAVGELIDPDVSKIFDAKDLRTARRRAQRYCYENGFYTERSSGAKRVKVDNYEYWNVLTMSEMYRYRAIQKDKEQASE